MAAQQLNQADRMAVRASRVMIDRCTAAVSNYALYLLGLGGSATAQQTAWAREAIRAPGGIGDQVSYHLLNQPTFLDKGSSITDDELKGVVETAINNHFIPAV